MATIDSETGVAFVFLDNARTFADGADRRPPADGRMTERRVRGRVPSAWFAHDHARIRTPDDVEGVALRTLGNRAAIFRDCFGAAPTIAPGTEIHGLFETKGTDAARSSMPSENRAEGRLEIARYVIHPRIHARAWAFAGPIERRTRKMPPVVETAMAAARIVTRESMLEFMRLDEAFQAETRQGARARVRDVAAEAEAAGDPWPETTGPSLFAFPDRGITDAEDPVADHRDRARDPRAGRPRPVPAHAETARSSASSSTVLRRLSPPRDQRPRPPRVVPPGGDPADVRARAGSSRVPSWTRTRPSRCSRPSSPRRRWNRSGSPISW